MSNDDDKSSVAVQLLFSTMKKQGMACGCVRDGHVLIFNRKFIQALLDKDPNQEVFQVLFKTPNVN